ncbi:hypothetical protein OIZ54_16000 [Pseudoalteromonas sp. A3]|uniref:hypothetical protein n=1 Tax=Pseudoalteromonas sp. A3 TaxID=142792 RepID=UPI002220B650|nr:hypothetical protein [Pseudoalteromonas sp. A3]MCW1720241.1 hypothetical protein [Pseudoalteromonas sp. A3]
MSRNLIANTLLLAAILLIATTEMYLVITFKSFILAGKGMGIYGVFLYFIMLIISSVFWFFSYRVSKNKLQALIFWLSALMLSPVIIFQSVWWSAPF